MANVIAVPRRPTDDWESKLGAWLSEMRAVVDQAIEWSEARGWSTKMDFKTIAEDLLGTYEAPRLLIHSPEARLLLDPIARCIVGAQGRFELCVIPSYDAVPLIKTDQGWRFVSNGAGGFDIAWSGDSFAKVCTELAAAA